MLKLFLVDSEQNRTVIPLLRSEITIGRGEGNTIRLTDQNISRVHARLVRSASGYALEDLSRYGIEGPSGPIQGSRAVASGETYRIGDYLLEFKEERASLPLPAARPRAPLPPADLAPPTSSVASTESAPVASSMTPPGTGTAVFLADEIDSALSLLEPKSSSTSDAASPLQGLKGSTAGSLAVEPEPLVERASSVSAAVPPPAAPPATSPSTVAMEELSSEQAATEPVKVTTTLRPTSVQAMKLVGQTAPFVGAELQLTLPRLVIGSDASCDVVLEHAGIAPEHLALRYDGSSWWVDALSGQVRVDGELTPTTKLWKGAVITLGGLDFRFADPLERLSVRLAPVAAPAAAASLLPASVGDADSEFDQAVLNRGKRNQSIGIGVGIVLALGIGGLLALGGSDAPATGAGAGSAASEIAAVASAPTVAAPAGSGSGSAAVAVAPEVDAKATEAKSAADAKAAADTKATEAKAAADAAKAAQNAEATQAAADLKVAAEAAKASKAEQAAKAAADRKAAADAAKTAREAKAAEAAQARAARAARAAATPAPRAVEPPKTAPARTAAPAPTPARAATPAKATPPTPFQEVAPAAAAAPTAASLISDAKRAAVQNNRKDAVKFLEQARRLDAKNAEVNQLLFSNYRALGNTLRASEAVRRYLALRPNDPQRADYEKWLEQNATP